MEIRTHNRFSQLRQYERSMLAYAVNHLMESKPADWWDGAMAEENKKEFLRLYDELIKDL